MTPVVSICCITYNHEKYISQAIDGFVSQKTTFPLEVIIHDDASTDMTAEIIREYENKYPNLIKPIYQNENQFSKGVKVSATYVWPKAKGKYLALCEGDDYWDDSYKLQKQVDFLESNPDYVMCYHDATIIEESGKVIKTRLADRYKKDLSKLDLRKDPPTNVLQILFRNIFLETELPKEMINVINADLFLVSMLGRFGKAKYMENIAPTAAYSRIHDGGIWSKTRHAVRYAGAANSYAWLSKYYKRVGDEEVAEYFRTKFLEFLNILTEKPLYGSKRDNIKRVAVLLKTHIDIIDDSHLESFIKYNSFYANTVGLWKDMRRNFIESNSFGKQLRRLVNKFK